MLHPGAMMADSGSTPFQKDDGKKPNAEETAPPVDEDSARPAGEMKTYREEGLVITVTQLPDEVESYSSFEVAVENQNALKKTLSGRICLFDLQIKQRECGSGECAVYMDLPPKSKEKKKLRCKRKSFFNAWIFEIAKIYGI
ncbi:MAG: hypothetical protein A2176_08045 [Spirochaetes bacterium RBG_13_51_14]|nr:MAG: hypothetical protein A2176_08045 [Spirochaetes bacterium RBG_13_51_14]